MRFVINISATSFVRVRPATVAPNSAVHVVQSENRATIKTIGQPMQKTDNLKKILSDFSENADGEVSLEKNLLHLPTPMAQLPPSNRNRYRLRLRYRRQNQEVISHILKQMVTMMSWRPISTFNRAMICSFHRHTHHRCRLILVQRSQAPFPTFPADRSPCFLPCHPCRMNHPR